MVEPAAGAQRRTADPRISVIVPSFNSAKFLGQAIRSAMDQIPPPYEIVVQDGSSTDDTLNVLRSFGSSVAWASAPDQGQSDALNRALARASGDAVIWLNADDMLAPGAFAAASEAFAADPALAFVYGDFDIIDEAGDLVRSYESSAYSWLRVYRQGCYIFSGSLFVRRDVLTAIGGFDPALRTCMDLDLLLRLGSAGRSAHLGRTIGRFRIHRTSKSSTIGATFVREAFSVRRRYARRSWTLWLPMIRATMIALAMQVTSRLRYATWWPRHGGHKTL